MRLVFLGVAAALTVGKDKFQSNMLVESEAGKKLLIDCGSDIRHSLLAQGYNHNEIDAVYISHLHSDHAGGLEWLGFCSYFIEQRRPVLYISPQLKNTLWDNLLSGSMCTLENEQATLSTFFDVKPITHTFTWENYQFHLVKVTHAISNGVVLPSYGLFITTLSQKIFITTDSRFSPDSLQRYYQDADLIFHDCETSHYSTYQHARYEQLKTLANEYKRKMWLYDYNDNDLPNAQADGFRGFVKKGQVFIF